MQGEYSGIEIRVDPHTIENLSKRGTSEDEVIGVIRSGRVTRAKFGRYVARRVLTDGYEQNGRFYRHKEVSVVYALDGDIIVTVTVKTRFGFWEEAQ